MAAAPLHHIKKSQVQPHCIPYLLNKQLHEKAKEKNPQVAKAMNLLSKNLKN